MFQRLISTLRRQELLTPAAFILAFLVVLSLVIILAQFFNLSLQEEMAGQFNQQQLLLAREVSMNISGFIDHVYRDLHVIARIPDIDQINRNSRVRTITEGITFNIQNETVITVRVVDRNGVVLFDSSFPGREGANLSKTDYCQKARLLPKNEKFITDLIPESPEKPGSTQFVIATPIYSRMGNEPAEFRGLV